LEYEQLQKIGLGFVESKTCTSNFIELCVRLTVNKEKVINTDLFLIKLVLSFKTIVSPIANFGTSEGGFRDISEFDVKIFPVDMATTHLPTYGTFATIV